MSVIGEVVGIVACVAAVVSAYKDGSQIVQKIKDKRRRSEADPPSRYLEQSLNQGATAVEQTHRAGVDRFGKAFTEGDDAALNDLRDITIQLQQSMLRELSKALEDDSMQDFTAVENAANTARVRTVNVLNDLFLRMQEDVLRNKSLPPPSADRNRIQMEAVTTLPLLRQIEHSRAPPPGRVYTLPDDNKPEALQRSYQAPSTAVLKQRHNSNSLSYIPGIKLFPRRTKSDNKSGATGLDNRLVNIALQPAAQPLPQDLGRSQQGQVGTGMFDSSSLSGNPWASTTDRPIGATSTNTHKPQRRHTSPGRTPHKMNWSPLSSNSPTPQDFRGFCKGAYYLQVRLKSDGMKLRNQSGSFLGEGYFYACSNSKCCFEAPACKTDKVWDIVDTTFGPIHGVRFRWSFLAKSHVELSKAKKRNFQYRCIFCTVQGSETTIFDGVTSLIDHVTQHRRETLSTEGRVLVDGDDFDIHFVADNAPADTESLRSRLSTSTIQASSLWSVSEDDNPWERP